MGNRATAHLYIVNPLRKVKKAAGLFDTHPPIELRIDLLLAMAHGQAAADAVADGSQALGRGNGPQSPPASAST